MENLKQLLSVSMLANMTQVCYLVSGELTIMTHCAIFINFSGILIIIYRFFAKQPLHRLEILGTIIALTGCLVTICDVDAEKVNPKN